MSRGPLGRASPEVKPIQSPSPARPVNEEFSLPEAIVLPPAAVPQNLPQRRPHPLRPSPGRNGADERSHLLGASEEDGVADWDREREFEVRAGMLPMTPRERHHHTDSGNPDLDKDKGSRGGKGKDKGKDKSKEKLDSDSDLERGVGRGVKEKEHGGGLGGKKGGVGNQALISGAAYCVSSCSMILLNKVVLSGFRWEAQISLMFYQNLVSVSVVIALSRLGIITTEPLTWRLARVWVPVNVIFVGMLVTSFYSLQYMQVAMVTILKNVTNLVTAIGEMYMFKKRHSSRVWGSLFLMILSALSGGITDLSFHPAGYTWQLFNCFFTAAYSLFLRRVMDKAKGATRSGHLSEFSMVLLNNSLSLPLGVVLIFLFGEINYVSSSPLMGSAAFWLVTTLSGLLGLAISFTSMWFLHQTSPTTYSLIGSLNKIPLSLAGILLFQAPTSVANLGSILFGCFAGVLFARAKLAG